VDFKKQRPTPVRFSNDKTADDDYSWTSSKDELKGKKETWEEPKQRKNGIW
jgi:hypothetical protein